MTCEESMSTVLSDVHADIIRTHILSRLDGPALGAMSCTSSELRALSGDDALWRRACVTAWPSVASLGSLVSGHRSFFSDAFAGLDPGPALFDPEASPAGPLVSAVDIFFEGKLIFSRVKETQTASEWSLGSPFRVDMLEPKESVGAWIPRAAAEDVDDWVRRLEEGMRVSWVVVDVAGGRAGNVASGAAVSAERHWLSGDVRLSFSTAMTGWGFQFAVGVTCGAASSGGRTHVGEVGFHVEDMDGRHVSGRESVALLANALRGPRRCAATDAEERERFQEYLRVKSLARLRSQRREKAIDMACLLTGLSIFVSFVSFLLFTA